jgi:hypothetical protein
MPNTNSVENAEERQLTKSRNVSHFSLCGNKMCHHVADLCPESGQVFDLGPTPEPRRVGKENIPRSAKKGSRGDCIKISELERIHALARTVRLLAGRKVSADPDRKRPS